eukprot:GHRQ01030760.1.p3 GENE.GHRQ01030760.1~~GHRQ01030760.1.p3  ORF type:complete len:129 (-),score=66.95 GHRQ01030760.1:322-708(-)
MLPCCQPPDCLRCLTIYAVLNLHLSASLPLRVVVLRCLREVCADGQLLVDLFVNYDCDLGSSNLFERLVSGLVKMAQAALPASSEAAQLQQEQWLRQEALQCLASASQALLAWYRASTGQGLAALEGT